MFIIIFLIGFSYSMNDIIYEELLNSLKNDYGWNVEKKMSDGSTIKSKNIIDMNISAMLIERELINSPIIIQKILIDILNYNKILKSSGSLKTKLFFKKNNYLDGYQYIKSGFPFISDRKYCFRMHYFDYSKNNKVLIEWYLLSNKGKYKEFLSQNNNDAIYLDYGAGVWIMEENTTGSYILSYRLFMHPGGFIPDFIIEKVNESSIYNIFNDVILESEKRKK